MGAALLALACLTWCAPSRAEGRRLLVLLGQKDPAFWPWLRAELGSSGFAVEPLSVASLPPSPAEIEQLAQREGGVIGLSPLEAGAGIEIWRVDPVSHKLGFRELLLGLYKPEEAPDVIALRMVETLRATLMDIETERASAPVAEPPPPSPVPKPAAPARLWLGLGGGGAFSPGGVGAVGYLDWSLAWPLSSRFSLALDGALTPTGATVHGPEGSAHIDWYLAGAALSFCVTNPKAALRLRSGAGAFVAWTTLLGQAVEPLENRRAHSVSAVPHVDLGLRWSLSERVGLAADGAAGLSAPGVAIDFAGREAATWGRPVWLGRLSLEAALN
jgi:hypothetical protein